MRALTYNIHKGIGGRDRRYSLGRIIEVIEGENPDLLCLQEVDRHVARSNLDDQPKLLAEAFHTAGALFQFNHRVAQGGYGNLLLSRWPIRRSHQITLRMGRRKNRGAQLAVIDTPEGRLHLINTHLGLMEGERHWQVHHLLDHRLFREAAHLPTLILGDTNDWMHTLGHGPFAEHGFREATAPPSRFRTFPAYLPMGGLDKVFWRGAMEIRHVRVVASALARVASDHRPLVVDFHLIAPEVHH